jgi:hypothetical protein
VKAAPEPVTQPEPLTEEKPEVKPEPKPIVFTPIRVEPAPRPVSPPPPVRVTPRTVQLQVINNGTGQVTFSVEGKQKVLNAGGQAFFDVPPGEVSWSWSFVKVDDARKKRWTGSKSGKAILQQDQVWSCKDEFDFGQQGFMLNWTVLN